MIDSALTLPCGAVLRNRIVKAAMSEQLADACNEPSPELFALYETWAQCGAASLITGNVMVEHGAVSEPGQVVLEDEWLLPAAIRWAQVAKSGGAHVWMQVNHGGRQIPRLLRAHPVAPSAVPMANRLFGPPTALTTQQIEQMVTRYARTANLAAKAGFTGVQVHGAHGYLINQFLSPLTNRRTDAWGGDALGRRRFLIEVLAAVRHAIGKHAVLALKLNASDFQRGGIDEDGAIETIEGLAASTIDVLEVSGGTFEAAAMLGVPSREGACPSGGAGRSAYFVEFARRARQRFPGRLMVTGGFRSAGAIEAALDSGAADLVGLARPMVLQPDLPRWLLNGATGHVSFDHRVMAPWPLRSGLLGGMAQIAWHTVQLWAQSEGRLPAPGLSPTLSVFKYLAKQAVQLRARRSPAWASET